MPCATGKFQNAVTGQNSVRAEDEAAVTVASMDRHREWWWCWCRARLIVVVVVVVSIRSDSEVEST